MLSFDREVVTFWDYRSRCVFETDGHNDLTIWDGRLLCCDPEEFAPSGLPLVAAPVVKEDPFLPRQKQDITLSDTQSSIPL